MFATTKNSRLYLSLSGYSPHIDFIFQLYLLGLGGGKRLLLVCDDVGSEVIERSHVSVSQQLFPFDREVEAVQLRGEFVDVLGVVRDCQYPEVLSGAQHLLDSDDVGPLQCLGGEFLAAPDRCRAGDLEANGEVGLLVVDEGDVPLDDVWASMFSMRFRIVWSVTGRRSAIVTGDSPRASSWSNWRIP